MVKVAAQWLHDILEALYQRRTITRPDIITATRLNPASVSHALRALLESGTILKIGELESRAGRPRELLGLNAEAAYFVAVDLEGTRVRFALTNLVGDIRCRFGSDLEFGQQLEIGTILDGIQAVLQSLDQVQLSRVLAVGVCHPGMADSKGRITAVNLNWFDFPLLEALQGALDLPVFLQDAHRTCILAERWLGVAQGSENCMYVIVGNGIGVGSFTDGHLLEGHQGNAGELGHIVIDPNAPDLCKCGRHGCLEAVASCPNIVRQYLETAGRDTSHPSGYRVPEVFEKARQGDPNALHAVQRASKYLGLAFSYLATLFNPEVIVIGGDIVQGQDLVLPLVREELLRYALPRSTSALEVKVSSLGLDIGLRGAAALAFRRSLSNSALLRKMCSPLSGGRRIGRRKAAKPHTKTH